MARQKLDLSPEERRKHNNEMHRKQTKARRERAIKNAYKEWVRIIMNTVEQVGWDKTQLLLGEDEEILDAVADELMKNPSYKITLGSKVGLKIEKGVE